ncbi:MAG TPA: BON domain-containing protein [Gemmatimonadaceae bacterium]|nr:BON domain-containing protein [Gemmatimonadaceae bacterium]HEX2600820.1 BON domain-containing protein [Gemmatimonadaceae bacterium]
MEKDYEDIRDTDDLNDNELRALVRDAFEQQMAVDPDDVSIAVRSGVVTLSGRVGTDEELRIAERIVTDMVGLEKVRNNLFVDPIRRAQSPEAIDEHLVDERLHEGLLLGNGPRPEDPEAEHLQEDLRAELFGTADVQQSIEDAIPWNPPDGPTPEGLPGSER